LKRAGLLLLPLAVAGALLLGFGRPPSRYVLESEAARLHELRREQYYLSTRSIARAAVEHAPVEALRAELERELIAPHRLTLGGWEVIFLPPGARAPDGDHAAWGELEPAAPVDPQALRGAWRVRMKPVAWTARFAATCGLGPALSRE